MMSKGLIKLDFPSVTMNEEEPEPIVESVPISVGEKITAELSQPLSEDEEEGGEEEGGEEKEKKEKEEKEGEAAEVGETVVEKIIEVEKIVGKKIPIPLTPVISSTHNILAGPWTRDSKSGAQTWGLGAEFAALRSGLAESCAERERYSTLIIQYFLFLLRVNNIYWVALIFFKGLISRTLTLILPLTLTLTLTLTQNCISKKN